MTKTLLLAASSVALIGTASAQTAQPQPYTDEDTGFYVGGGYSFVDIETDSDIDAFDDQGDSTNALTGRVGYQVTPVFSIEGDVTVGFDDGGFDLDGDEIDFDDINSFDDIDDSFDRDNLSEALANGGDIGLDYLIGLYGRVGMPLGERFHVSGRAGYAITEIDVTNTATFTSVDDLGDTDDTNDVTTVQTVTQSQGGSDSGFAFGGSLRYSFNPSSAIRGDYTRYNFGDANADVITVSYQHTF